MSRHRPGTGGGNPGSTKEEAIEVEGTVVQALGAGRYRIQVDGIYDLVTRSVVHAFQSRFLGLAGGICGPDTAQMIFAVEQLFARDPRAD